MMTDDEKMSYAIYNWNVGCKILRSMEMAIQTQHLSEICSVAQQIQGSDVKTGSVSASELPYEPISSWL